MTTLLFDTHRAVKSLEEAGFEESQAEAVVEMFSGAVGENLATKADLKVLEQAIRSDLQTMEQATKTDLQTMEQAIRSDLQALEQATKADLQALEQTLGAELKSLELRMTIKLGGLVFAGFGVMIAFLKLLP